jgi:hypothetical protein
VSKLKTLEGNGLFFRSRDARTPLGDKWVSSRPARTAAIRSDSSMGPISPHRKQNVLRWASALSTDPLTT